MRCRRAQRWMTVADALVPRRRRALERHLADCASCRADGVVGMKLDAALAALPTHAPVPASLEYATLRTVRQLAAAEEERPSRGLSWWLGIAVPGLAAATAVVLAVGLSRGPVPDQPPAADRVAHDDHAAAPRVVARRDADAHPAPKAAPAVEVAHGGARRPSIDDPPAELIAAPERFIDMPVLRDFDKLRHYDAISGIDDDQSDPGQVPQSDG